MSYSQNNRSGSKERRGNLPPLAQAQQQQQQQYQLQQQVKEQGVAQSQEITYVTPYKDDQEESNDNQHVQQQVELHDPIDILLQRAKETMKFLNENTKFTEAQMNEWHKGILHLHSQIMKQYQTQEIQQPSNSQKMEKLCGVFDDIRERFDQILELQFPEIKEKMKQKILLEMKNERDSVQFVASMGYFIYNSAIKAKEDRRIEFKNYQLSSFEHQNPYFRDKIKKTIVSFLNEQGGAIYIGIRDFDMTQVKSIREGLKLSIDQNLLLMDIHSVQGVDLSSKDMDTFKLLIGNIRRQIEPDCNNLVNIDFLPVKKWGKFCEGKWVVRLRVDQGDLNKLYAYQSSQDQYVFESTFREDGSSQRYKLNQFLTAVQECAVKPRKPCDPIAYHPPDINAHLCETKNVRRYFNSQEQIPEQKGEARVYLNNSNHFSKQDKDIFEKLQAENLELRQQVELLVINQKPSEEFLQRIFDFQEFNNAMNQIKGIASGVLHRINQKYAPHYDSFKNNNSNQNNHGQNNHNNNNNNNSQSYNQQQQYSGRSNQQQQPDLRQNRTKVEYQLVKKEKEKPEVKEKVMNLDPSNPQLFPSPDDLQLNKKEQNEQENKPNTSRKRSNSQSRDLVPWIDDIKLDKKAENKIKQQIYIEKEKADKADVGLQRAIELSKQEEEQNNLKQQQQQINGQNQQLSIPSNGKNQLAEDDQLNCSYEQYQQPMNQQLTKQQVVQQNKAQVHQPTFEKPHQVFEDVFHQPKQHQFQQELQQKKNKQIPESTLIPANASSFIIRGNEEEEEEEECKGLNSQYQNQSRTNQFNKYDNNYPQPVWQNSSQNSLAANALFKMGSEQKNMKKNEIFDDMDALINEGMENMDDEIDAMAMHDQLKLEQDLETPQPLDSSDFEQFQQQEYMAGQYKFSEMQQNEEKQYQMKYELQIQSLNEKYQKPDPKEFKLKIVLVYVFKGLLEFGQSKLKEVLKKYPDVKIEPFGATIRLNLSSEGQKTQVMKILQEAKDKLKYLKFFTYTYNNDLGNYVKENYYFCCQIDMNDLNPVAMMLNFDHQDKGKLETIKKKINPPNVFNEIDYTFFEYTQDIFDEGLGKLFNSLKKEKKKGSGCAGMIIDSTIIIKKDPSDSRDIVDVLYQFYNRHSLVEIQKIVEDPNCKNVFSVSFENSAEALIAYLYLKLGISSSMPNPPFEKEMKQHINIKESFSLPFVDNS